MDHLLAWQRFRPGTGRSFLWKHHFASERWPNPISRSMSCLHFVFFLSFCFFLSLWVCQPLPVWSRLFVLQWMRSTVQGADLLRMHVSLSSSSSSSIVWWKPQGLILRLASPLSPCVILTVLLNFSVLNSSDSLSNGDYKTTHLVGKYKGIESSAWYRVKWLMHVNCCY